MTIGQFKIRTRLAVVLGLFVIFMFLFILLGISSLGQINDQMEKIVKINSTKIWYANMIQDSLHTMDKSVLTIISTKDEVARSFEKVKILTARSTYGGALEKLETLEKNKKGKELLQRLKDILAVEEKNNESTLEKTLDGRSEQAITFYMQTQRPYALNLQQICAELVAYEKQQSDLHYQESVRIYNKTRNSFLFIGALATLSGLLIAIFFARSITRPLAEGVRIANRLAEGDFTVPIEVQAGDETGQLLLALKNMAEKLKQVQSLEQQLLQSQKLENVGRLAGGIAHDFNNLLTVIGGFSELTLRKMNGNESLKNNIREIQKAAERAGNLTRQLLAFSRRQIMEMKNVDLNLLLKDLEKMLARLINEDIEFNLIMAQDLGTVMVDPGQIEQVIVNLVVNAKDAMPSGGRLTIETANCELDETFCQNHVGSVSGPYVRLSVSDTGIGMTPEVKKKVFEPFFTTKEMGKGTGLGLSMVYGIVKQSGGHVWVYSEEGYGTTCKIYLPRQETQADPVLRQEEVVQLARRTETVLLVEDEPSVRSLSASVLRDQGYQVLEAGNGLEALHLAREKEVNRINLLLTDVIMPKMSGRELADTLIGLHPEMKVLFTSGYTDDVIAHHGVLEPDTAFLQKPFTPISLARKVQEVFEPQG